MKSQKSEAILIAAVILSLAIVCVWPSPILAAFSEISPELEKPEFWIQKIKNPNRILLTPEEIRKMNEKNLQRQDLYLCRVKEMKEMWTREEVLSLLREDWGVFGKGEEVRYGRDGKPLGEAFWSKLRMNMNEGSLSETIRLVFGLIVRRTDIRVFPTHEVSMSDPGNHEFDRFQHSALAPGSLVGIYHFSKDRLWSYVQTSFIRGWVRSSDLALSKERREAIEYEEEKRLTVTGSFADVFSTPSFDQVVFRAQMGTTFPVLNLHPPYAIRTPLRNADGQVAFRQGYVQEEEDVHLGYLPFTQEKIARQAFKMLHQPYGWGEMFGGRDCSRFIMDLFGSFGLLMPRNSKFQAAVGTDLGPLEGKTLKEKQNVLDRAVPLTTTLRLPNHIMLYLGKDRGKYYAIHNIWGVGIGSPSGPVIKKIGKAVVSDLDLGSSGQNGSLLNRITDARSIGPTSEGKGKPDFSRDLPLFSP